MEHDPDQGLDNSARRGKLRRASSMAYANGAGPKPPTEAQWQMLAALLGGWDYRPSRGEIEAYVRMANGYTYQPLKRSHFIEAITLRKEGFNSYGFEIELCQLSDEPDTETTPHLGEMKRRLIARQKSAKAAKYSKPRQTVTMVGDKMPSQKLAPDKSSGLQLRDAQRIAAMELLAKRRFRNDG